MIINWDYLQSSPGEKFAYMAKKNYFKRDKEGWGRRGEEIYFVRSTGTPKKSLKFC